MSTVSGEEAVLASEEVVEEHAAVEEVVEEDAAVAGGEGEALRSLLEVGNFGFLRSDLVNSYLRHRSMFCYCVLF